MTPQQYRDALYRLRLGKTVQQVHERAAVLIGKSWRMSFRYAAGTSEVPPSVERLVLLFLHRGIPQGWRDSL